MSGWPGQQGLALVVALLVVALVAILSGALVQDQGYQVFFFEGRHATAQGRQYAHAGLDWARAVLYDDSLRSSVDYRGEPWATRIPPTRAGEAEVSGYLEEQQGRFNINNLVQGTDIVEPQRQVFLRLLQGLGLPVRLAVALLEARGAGPAMAARRVPLAPLTEVAALARVAGFDAPTLALLAPQLCALPEPTPVNVNFASAELLAALIPELQPAEAQALARSRDNTPFLDLSDFKARLPREAMRLDPAMVAVSSRFFMAEVMVRAQQATVRLQALLRRDSGWPEVVWEAYR